MPRKRERRNQNQKLKPKPEDVEAAKALLGTISSAFAMAGMSVQQLRQMGVDIKPAVYYPEHGNSIYLGFKLELPNEDSAKYMWECFKAASKEMSRR